MHSFHQSRGRIFFEIFCALTIATACAVAWLQTGATALLAVSAVAALYSIVHATDAGRRPAAPPIQSSVAEAADLAAQPSFPAAEALLDEPKAAISKPKRRSRKKQTVEAAVPVVIEVAVEEAVEEHVEEPSETVARLEVEEEEDFHPPIATLFEPQPMVRQQRPIFGRKAG